MSKKEELAKKSADYLLAGYNCAQSVLLAAQELLGMHNDEVVKSVTGLGGGIGNLGDVCGAASGGVIALSQKFGRSDLDPKTAQRKDQTYKLAAEYMKRFKEVAGTTICRDVVPVDLTDPEARKAYWNPETRRKCAEEQVAQGFRILYDILLREGVVPPEHK